MVWRCELLSDFLSLFFEHNEERRVSITASLWIAFRFFIFVLRTQLSNIIKIHIPCCELLSDFLSLFFEHNTFHAKRLTKLVVNCFQIFYLCSSNTTVVNDLRLNDSLWIAFRFFIFVLRTQLWSMSTTTIFVVNCFQIFYLCSSNTTQMEKVKSKEELWIAFRFFIFVLRTQHNQAIITMTTVVNCFQIFYLCSSNTTCSDIYHFVQKLWIAFRFFIFVLRTQHEYHKYLFRCVVNCFQIFYLCSSNTTCILKSTSSLELWIAFRFFIFVLRTQRQQHLASMLDCCELLSDFLSLFFEHNRVLCSVGER